MPSEADGRAAFRVQQQWCRAMGAPVYARLCEALADELSRETRTGVRVLDWPGDATADAVPLRLLGGLNALVRAGRDEALAAVFAGDVDGAAAALAGALKRYDGELLAWLDGAPQTNEVGRAAAIVAALLVARDRFAMPFELLELGASAGLLLNLARYRYRLGGTEVGDPASALTISPDWRGPPPPMGAIEVAGACGVDLHPLDLADAAVRERLTAFIWPEQPERLARLEQALAIARAYPPRIDRAEGATWIADRLAEQQPAGVCRVVLHSIALQYFPPEAQARVRAAIKAAGARATPERPLAWISYEMDAARSAVALHLTTWPGNEGKELATCHPHAAWIEWPGLSGSVKYS